VDPKILAAITEEYRKTIPQKLELLDQLVKCLENEKTIEALKGLRQHIHKLAGSAGTYGFDEVSALCKQWDLRLLQLIDRFPVEGIEGSLWADLALLSKNIKQGFGYDKKP
jgi:HPt (histidine-containing phosphotransfer) domain-containing protein